MTVLAHTVENANHRHTISIGNLFGLCEKVRVSSILYVWIPLNSLCPYSIGWLSSTLCTGYEADIMRVSLLICEWGTSKARNVEKGTSLQSRVSRTLLFCLEFMTVCDVWVSLSSSPASILREDFHADAFLLCSFYLFSSFLSSSQSFVSIYQTLAHASLLISCLPVSFLQQGCFFLQQSVPMLVSTARPSCFPGL